MQTIIDIWRGDIAPVERCGAYDREASLLALKMERLQTKAEEGLTEAQTEALREYVRQADAYNFRMMELAFREGFSLGTRLASEALN